MNKEKAFEYVRCNLCGADNYEILYESNIEPNSPLTPSQVSVAHTDASTGRIVRCKKCGLVYVNPRDSWIKLRENYEKLSEKEYLEEKESRLLTFKRNLKYLNKFVKKPGKLLDIGCQVGLFLKVARDAKWDVCGVEISKITSAYSRNNYGLNVITGELKDVNFLDNYFDLITLWDLKEVQRLG